MKLITRGFKPATCVVCGRDVDLNVGPVPGARYVHVDCAPDGATQSPASPDGKGKPSVDAGTHAGSPP